MEATEGCGNIVGYCLPSFLDVMLSSPIAVTKKAVGNHIEIIYYEDPHTAVSFYKEPGILAH